VSGTKDRVSYLRVITCGEPALGVRLSALGPSLWACALGVPKFARQNTPRRMERDGESMAEGRGRKPVAGSSSSRRRNLGRRGCHTIRRGQLALARRKLSRSSRRPRIERAWAQVSCSHIWGTQLCLCHRRGLQTRVGIPYRRIQRWASITPTKTALGSRLWALSFGSGLQALDSERRPLEPVAI